jgi:hypothetical protein
MTGQAFALAFLFCSAIASQNKKSSNKCSILHAKKNQQIILQFLKEML